MAYREAAPEAVRSYVVVPTTETRTGKYSLRRKNFCSTFVVGLDMILKGSFGFQYGNTVRTRIFQVQMLGFNVSVHVPL